MISFDFEYYRPTSIEETIDLYKSLRDEGKEPIYYAGGSEIISMARANQRQFGAVIDIKEIPECTIFEEVDNQLIIGSAITLTQICDANTFPLLTEIARRSADHTARNRITLGGNICGMLPYRETVLPFLLCDSSAMLVGPKGQRIVRLDDIFNQHVAFEDGELLVQLITDTYYISLPYQAIKKTKQGEVDYPLLTVAGIETDSYIKVAISGLHPYPFRSDQVDEYINNLSIPIKERIDNALTYLSDMITSDLLGSAEYREFLMGNILEDMLNALEKGA